MDSSIQVRIQEMTSDGLGTHVCSNSMINFQKKVVCYKNNYTFAVRIFEEIIRYCIVL